MLIPFLGGIATLVGLATVPCVGDARLAVSEKKNDGFLFSKQNEMGKGYLLFSDIDDTIICSGGSWPKGTDDLCYTDEVYPGLMQLYLELSAGPDFVAHPPFFRLVSARPKITVGDPKSLEKKSWNKLSNATGLLNGRTWGVDEDRSGFGRFVDFFSTDWAATAERKAQNIIKSLTKPGGHYTQAGDGAKGYIWIGDSGQGDFLTGVKLMRSGGEEPAYVLIHNLESNKESHQPDLATLPDSQRDKFIFYTSIKQLAHVLLKRGAITEAARDRVNKAIQNSAIYRLCQTADGAYPCPTDLDPTEASAFHKLDQTVKFDADNCDDRSAFKVSKYARKFGHLKGKHMERCALLNSTSDDEVW
mmetsp:Transcript_18565/g.44722  ORF Transcript_18565/g.44722 Transcript_18565/m.44722 type:complete len:360 (-) Transcript_18565:125-1204(-)